MKNTEEKILCRTPFRSGRRSLVCARLGSKGKVGVQRGRKTVGCPSFLPPPRERRCSRRPQTANPPAEVQRKTPRPSGANPPAAVRVPRSAGAAKGAARQGRTRLRQFACPGQPVQQKEPPVRGEHANAVRVPWPPCAEKRKAPQNCFHGAQSMHFYSNRSSVSTALRAGACGSCAG